MGGDIVVTCEKHGHSRPGACPWCRNEELERRIDKVCNWLRTTRGDLDDMIQVLWRRDDPPA